MWGILNKPRFNDIYLFSAAAGYLPSLLMSNLVGIPLLLEHLSTSILRLTAFVTLFDHNEHVWGRDEAGG